MSPTSRYTTHWRKGLHQWSASRSSSIRMSGSPVLNLKGVRLQGEQRFRGTTLRTRQQLDRLSRRIGIGRKCMNTDTNNVRTNWVRNYLIRNNSRFVLFQKFRTKLLCETKFVNRILCRKNLFFWVIFIAVIQTVKVHLVCAVCARLEWKEK